MKQVHESTDNSFKILSSYNNKFINGFIFNFDTPKIFNVPPFTQALMGEVFINTRNCIGIYQGDYLLYRDNDKDLIRLQILSKDRKSKLYFDSNDINKMVTNFKGVITLKFDDFIFLLDNNKFILQNK